MRKESLERAVEDAIARENRRVQDLPLDASDIAMIERVWHAGEFPHDPKDCSICQSTPDPESAS